MPEVSNIVIQGFGNAGSNAAIIWEKAGHKILAVSDSKGGVYDPEGLDIRKLLTHKKTGETDAQTLKRWAAKSGKKFQERVRERA